MRVITANVNGIRAMERRGGIEWLVRQQADVVALQEIRATTEQLLKALAGSQLASWNVAHHPADAAGRAGVAVLSPHPLTACESGMASLERAGRWLEADVALPNGPAMRIASAYVHTGEAGTPKQDEKYAMLDAMTGRLPRIVGRPAVVAGDLNICHRQADLKNWKGNRGKAGFLPREQQYLTDWFADGWTDVVRDRAGDVDGPYTWWSWRGKAFDNDTGWRIDYQIASPSLAPCLAGVRVGRAPSYAQRWSDHAAVIVDYDV